MTFTLRRGWSIAMPLHFTKPAVPDLVRHSPSKSSRSSSAYWRLPIAGGLLGRMSGGVLHTSFRMPWCTPWRRTMCSLLEWRMVAGRLVTGGADSGRTHKKAFHTNRHPALDFALSVRFSDAGIAPCRPGYRPSAGIISSSAIAAQGLAPKPEVATKRTNRPARGAANLTVFRWASSAKAPWATGWPQSSCLSLT